jgi:hypothetical protein
VFEIVNNMKWKSLTIDGKNRKERIVSKAGSTLAANSRSIKRFLTPSLAAC